MVVLFEQVGYKTLALDVVAEHDPLTPLDPPGAAEPARRRSGGGGGRGGGLSIQNPNDPVE